MRGTLVAVDLETTGLDPLRDSVIEIGAVRIENGTITEEYSTLINPGIAIPGQVTNLTGISNEQVSGAPRIESVIPALRDFVGSVPVIAHNIMFDITVLNRYGILKDNLRLDTYDLAATLLPSAARYNLTSLTLESGIALEHAHRALDDARATALLYWHLWQRALTLPYSTLREIDQATGDLAWDARPFFVAVAQDLINSATTDQPAGSRLFAPFTAAKPFPTPERTAPIATETVTNIFTEQGTLAQGLPSYEQREQQGQMAEHVTRAFNEARHMMIEAGTGTGKSLAYLVPAILWAVENNQRIVISTNTIALQDQLIHNEIPLLKALLAVDFEVAAVKGRSNYLCPRRLNTLQRRKPTNIDELRTYAKVLVWLLESQTGDKNELNLRGNAEHTAWQRMSAEDESCTIDQCHAAMNGVCPFYKARKTAESAHLLIVNHALLISDVLNDENVLPDYRYLIIDEAHQLEEAITRGISSRLDESMLARRLSDLGNARRGLMGDLLSSVSQHAPQKDADKLARFIETISAATSAMGVHIEALFKAVQGMLLDIQHIRASDFGTTVRITAQHRGKSSFAHVQAVWATLNEFFEVVGAALARLTASMHKLEQYNIPELNDLISSTSTAARYLADMRAQLNAFLVQPDENTIYWISVGQHVERPAFHTAPVHIGSLMEQYIWGRKDAVVLTSATLRTNGEFNFIRDRLYAEDVETIELGSPFNYRESTLVYVPDDFPEPNEKEEYQLAIERGIIELATALDGRVMALFTSYSQLKQTAHAIAPRLELGNIAVYDQSDGSSRQMLLDGFKSTQKAVLLGTKSFWEGVDIPGDSLSALIITRLPFAVPLDPIFAARSETYQDSFQDYAVPDAILRFRQGFGRLIRTQTDRGIVAIFDRRVITKTYGASFLQSLPDCTMKSGRLEDLPAAAVNWLKRV